MDAAATAARATTGRWPGKRERGRASSRREEPVDRSGDERTRGERVDGGRERWSDQGVEGTSIKEEGRVAREFEFFCLLVAPALDAIGLYSQRIRVRSRRFGISRDERWE